MYIYIIYSKIGFIYHLKHKTTQFYAERVVFLAMNKLKYKPTITSSIPNYISKANALFERAD